MKTICCLDLDDTLIASTQIAASMTSGDAFLDGACSLKLTEQECRSINMIRSLLVNQCEVLIITNANWKWIDFIETVYPSLSAYISDSSIR
jgi:hypothetical protein